MQYQVPNEHQAKIIRENGINPKEVAVTHATENNIHMLFFKTRDKIIIEKGDRPW